MKKHWLLGCMGILIWASFVHAQVWMGCGNDRQGGVSKPPTCGEGINQFDVFTGNAHRAIRDLEVWGGVGEHQLVWQRYHNTRFTGSSQFLGTGGNWRHSYQWEMADAGTEAVSIFYPDGTANTFQKYSSDGILWLSTPAVPERLFVNTNLHLFVLQRQDGWQYTFTNDVNNGTYQLLHFTDSQGNRYDYTYDTAGRLSRVSEPAGRYLQITYTNISVALSDAQTITVYAPGDCQDNTWKSRNVTTSAYRYYRYVGPDGSYCNIGEIKLFKNWFDYENPKKPLTGTPFGPGNGYGNAFDGDTSTFYSHSSPSGGYTGIDLCSTNVSSLVCVEVFPRAGIGYGALMDGGRIEGFNIAPATLSCIANVSTWDGRGVTYTYSTLNDPVVSTNSEGSVQYQLLTRADYGDGTHAEYIYQQIFASTRPLLVHAVDPRYTGSAVNIGYIYNNTSLGNVYGNNVSVLGSVRKEINGASATEDALATLTTLSATNSMVNYANTAVHRICTYTGVGAQVAAVTDGLGRTTTHAYGSSGRGFLTTTTDAAGHHVEWDKSVYDNPLSSTKISASNSNLALREEWIRDDLDLVLTNIVYASYDRTTLTGSGPHTTVYTRDALHRVTGITHPDNSTEAFTYNDFGQVLTHTLRNGQIERFTYDNRGLRITAKDALQNETAYTYDAADRLASVTDPLGHVTQYAYNERGLVTQITYADGSSKAFSYDSFGNLTAEVNSMGQYWIYAYDEFRRRTQVTDPLGRVTRYGFGGGPGGCASCGAASKPTSIILPSGKAITITYDVEWQKTSETVGGMTTTYDYDMLGNLRAITDPNGKTWTNGYDFVSRLVSTTDPLNRTTVWTYDGYGNKLTETRPGPETTSFYYNPMNQTTNIVDASGHSTAMTYDDAGRLYTVQDAKGQTYTYTYDNAGRLASETYPDGSQESYVYDGAGNMIQYTSRSGKITTFSYDERNREIQSVTQN